MDNVMQLAMERLTLEEQESAAYARGDTYTAGLIDELIKAQTGIDLQQGIIDELEEELAELRKGQA
jgi:hypothetical protein